jgi:hypothetical protein
MTKVEVGFWKDEEVNFCDQCGAKINSGARFCSSCGHDLKNSSTQITSDKTIKVINTTVEKGLKKVENRVSIRIKIRQLVDLVLIGSEYHHIKEEANASIKNITIIDISCGGICIEIDKELIPGSKLALTIPPIGNLPKSTIECKVTRSKSFISDYLTGTIKHNVGLKYNTPNTEYLKNLYEFLKSGQN